MALLCVVETTPLFASLIVTVPSDRFVYPYASIHPSIHLSIYLFSKCVLPTSYLFLALHLFFLSPCCPILHVIFSYSWWHAIHLLSGRVGSCRWYLHWRRYSRGGVSGPSDRIDKSHNRQRRGRSARSSRLGLLFPRRVQCKWCCG